MPRVTYQDLLRSSMAQGFPLDKALEFLRGSGASPLEAAYAVQGVTGLSWHAARDLVARTRAWSAPRSGVQPGATRREWYGAIGQHGRSGHGAASVLPHLLRQGQSQAGNDAAASR
jgi:hypothetical protein